MNKQEQEPITKIKQTRKKIMLYDLRQRSNRQNRKTSEYEKNVAKTPRSILSNSKDKINLETRGITKLHVANAMKRTTAKQIDESQVETEEHKCPIRNK